MYFPIFQAYTLPYTFPFSQYLLITIEPKLSGTQALKSINYDS